MTIPATAGRVISEEELRAYTKCSQLFHYGGTVEEPLLTKVVRFTVEHMLVTSLKEDIENPSLEFTPSLRRVLLQLKVKDLLQDAEVDQLLRNSTYALNEIWKVLNPKELMPISGPLDYKMKVSKTPVQLRISGVLRKQKTKELIVPVFMPVALSHSVLNDPVLHLKLDLIRQFGTAHHKRPTASAYAFAVQSNGEVIFHLLKDTEQSKQRLKMIELQIKAMEIGYHYPVLPCLHTCPFKQRCFPERE
jgi:hypothetical protein